MSVHPAGLPTVGDPDGEPGDDPGAPGGAPFIIGPATEPPLTYAEYFPYDPNAQASAADRAAWLKWGAQAAGAHLIRPDLDDALRVYDHYRDNSGTPMTVDYEEAYREDANIASAVDAEIARARSAAEDLAAQSGSTSFSMTGDASLASALGGYPSTENWQKAVGDHQIWSSADVTVENGTATMVISVHAHDRYDFNAGMSDIATGTPDDENGRFAVLGWARPFDTRGELTRTITWTVGDSAPVGAGDGDVSAIPAPRIGPTSSARPPTLAADPREHPVGRHVITGRRAGALVLAAGLLLTSCTSGSEENSVSQSFLPSAARSDPGPVRHDPEPLTKRFPGLGEPVSVTWQSGTVGDPAVPGPSTYWIDAAVQVRPSVMQSLQATAGLTGTPAPDLPEAVHDAVPDGPWQTADALAAAFASPGFGTQVYLAPDDVVVLRAVGSRDGN